MRKIVNCWREYDLQILCLILASMSSKLEKSHEYMKHASAMHIYLGELYFLQICYEYFNTFKKLFRVHIVEGSSVSRTNLYIDLILQSLPGSFDQFVMNFNMSKLDMTVNKLVNTVVTSESTMMKDKIVLVTSISKAHKGKSKKKKKEEEFFF
ncbi:hypothetical protein CDL12_17389 [Handroanthus impetiginosus]|uniref:Uncharacterized protein n=1 Tax=Handroanthus impetiginosus TaxID=429701 RepID=A0A2G9GXM1_9LAMI|nr:hypothetical protein CDL12_17389 [Handroanthus impetiginosus]